MKSKLLILILASVILLTLLCISINAGFGNVFGYSNLEIPQLPPEINYSKLPTVNASEILITDQGNIDNINTSQFEVNTRILNIKESWLTTFINTFGFLTSETNASTECGTGYYLDGAGICFHFNDTVKRLFAEEQIVHNATNIVTITGTLDDGDLESVKVLGDGETYNVSEVSGATGFLININFTDVVNFNVVALRGMYDGGAGHTVALELKRVGVGWEERHELTDQNDFGVTTFDVFIGSDFIDEFGTVQFRINHDDVGNINHNYFLDAVFIGQVTGIVSGRDLADLTGRDNACVLLPDVLCKDGSKALTGNWNVGNNQINLTNLSTKTLSLGDKSVAVNSVINFYGSTNSGSITFDESADKFYFGNTDIFTYGGLDVQGVTYLDELLTLSAENFGHITMGWELGGGGYRVTSDEWQYLVGLDQSVDTTSSPTFVDITADDIDMDDLDADYINANIINISSATIHGDLNVTGTSYLGDIIIEAENISADYFNGKLYGAWNSSINYMLGSNVVSMMNSNVSYLNQTSTIQSLINKTSLNLSSLTVAGNSILQKNVTIGADASATSRFLFGGGAFGTLRMIGKGSVAQFFYVQNPAQTSFMYLAMTSVSSTWTTGGNLLFNAIGSKLQFQVANDGHVIIAQDNVNFSLGSGQDLDIRFDGTDAMFNVLDSGTFRFFNGSGYATPVAHEWGLASPSLLDKGNRLDALPENPLDVEGKLILDPIMKGVTWDTIQIRDATDCWDVIDHYIYCYVVGGVENCLNEQIPDWKDHEDITDEIIKEVIVQECGTKPQNITLVGGIELENRDILSKLKQENQLLKNTLCRYHPEDEICKEAET